MISLGFEIKSEHCFEKTEKSVKDKYEMAGRIIEISSLHEMVHAYCADYRAEGTADFTVETSQEDIECERERSARVAQAEGRDPYGSSDGYLEELAVYRKIAEKMPNYDTFLFHGSCIAVDGEAYLFTAKSGTGKSTHARLWRELLGERVVMVNDDKPLITVEEGRVMIHGTPYNGKHHLGTKMTVPLKAICLLERSKENWIRSVSRKEAFPMLLQQTYRPSERDALVKTIDLLEKMSELVGLYRLGVNMEPEAAKMAYEELCQGNGGN